MASKLGDFQLVRAGGGQPRLAVLGCCPPLPRRVRQRWRSQTSLSTRSRAWRMECDGRAVATLPSRWDAVCRRNIWRAGPAEAAHQSQPISSVSHSNSPRPNPWPAGDQSSSAPPRASRMAVAQRLAEADEDRARRWAGARWRGVPEERSNSRTHFLAAGRRARAAVELQRDASHQRWGVTRQTSGTEATHRSVFAVDRCP